MKNALAKYLAAMVVAVASVAAVAQTVEIEGVKFEPAAQVGGTALVLNGAGLRTKAIFKVYAAGLYVPQKSNDASALLAQKGARRVAITMLRNVDAESFAGALNDGLRDNHTEAQFAAMRPQIEALNANLKAVGEAKKGALILFEFIPGAGTRVTEGGQPRGTVIPGEEFFTAVLRIWIGDKPADGGLKKGMLGG